MLVIALGLAGLGAAGNDFWVVFEKLVLIAEMPAAGLFSIKCIVTHHFAKL